MQRIIIAVLVILFLVGICIRTCVWTGGGKEQAQVPPAPPAGLRPMPLPKPTTAPAAELLAPVDRSQIALKLRPLNRSDADPARLMVLYDMAGTPEYKEYSQLVRQSHLFDDLVKTVNDLVPLKRNLVIRFTEIGQPNAFYSQKEDSISVGYEFVDSFNQSYKGPEEGRMDFVRGATYFFVLHELGHALIHRMDLPVGSHEEDAADEFATILLLQQGEEGQQAILASAQYFKDIAVAAAKDGEVPVLWDEHSLNIQRFYNIIAWIYGVDPYRQVHLISSGLLPEERAARAHDEYLALRKRWKALLDDKLKSPLK